MDAESTIRAGTVSLRALLPCALTRRAQTFVTGSMAVWGLIATA